MAPPTTLKNTRVKRFSPTGLSDSLDATDEFPGACSSLSNLIPDLTTRNLWTCRPASTQLLNLNSSPNLPSANTAGLVAVAKVIGNIIYGLGTTVSGATFPFAYNLSSSSWITVTVTGVLPGAAPVNNFFLATADLVGTNLIVCHCGFPFSSAYFGWFDLSTPTTPVWDAGNTTSGSALTFSATTGAPNWVVQFNQRAWFGVNPPGGSQSATWFTDVLALKITNAGQALTYGDSLPLTTAFPLGLSNQLGGIIQSLMVFKGVTNIAQVTGDYALSNLSINTLNVATGTLSPRAVCSTPLGLAFMSPAGLRIIDQNGTVSDPIGNAGKGVTVPFILNIYDPLYTVFGCDGVTLRITFKNGSLSWQEYWFDLLRKVWSGPHTYASYQFVLYNGNFLSVPAPQYVIGYIYTSPTYASVASTYTEFGSPLTFTMQSASLEDNQQMAASEVVETQTVGAVGSGSLTAAVSFLDGNGNVINTANVAFTTPGLQAYHVDFPALSVFNRMAIQITGNSAAGFKLGDTFLRLRTLSYLPPPP